MQNILFKQSMTWRKSNCVECEAGVDSGKWSLTLKEVEERCRRKYKNCMRWLISLPFLILKHKKSSCNSWHGASFLLKTSQYISVFLLLLQWPIVQFTYVLHDAGQTLPLHPGQLRDSVGECEQGLFDSEGQKKKKKKATVQAGRAASVTAVSTHTWKKYNSCKCGGPCGHSPANKQPTIPFSRVDFAWTYLLIVIVSFLPAPSGERVSKHAPLPHRLAVNQRPKDAWQKEGKRAVREVKTSRVKFESIETERINRLCLSPLLLIPVVHLVTAAE